MRRSRAVGKKKMRCQNIIETGKCSYNDNCMFAHSLQEQVLTAKRKLAFEIIESLSDLSGVNILTDNKLYENLKCLTKMCSECVKGTCIGGNNCEHGACRESVLVCLEDMNKGTCNTRGCTKEHLSHKGLVPYTIRLAGKESKPINFMTGNASKHRDARTMLMSNDNTLDCETSIFSKM